MAFGELIGATVGMITMAISVVLIYVAHERKMAINKAEIDYLREDLGKLEKRVQDLEDKLLMKVDKIMEKLNNIDLKIAKL
jgi:ubiquinone biosynthesis protein UbiJ